MTKLSSYQKLKKENERLQQIVDTMIFLHDKAIKVKGFELAEGMVYDNRLEMGINIHCPLSMNHEDHGFRNTYFDNTLG